MHWIPECGALATKSGEITTTLSVFRRVWEQCIQRLPSNPQASDIVFGQAETLQIKLAPVLDIETFEFAYRKMLRNHKFVLFFIFFFTKFYCTTLKFSLKGLSLKKRKAIQNSQTAKGNFPYSIYFIFAKKAYQIVSSQFSGSHSVTLTYATASTRAWKRAEGV